MHSRSQRKLVVFISTNHQNDYHESNKLEYFCLKNNFSYFHLIINRNFDELESTLKYLKKNEQNIFCVISWCKHGIYSESLDLNLYSYFNAPFIAYIVDPISSFHSFLENHKLENATIYCFDEGECDEWRKLYKNKLNVVSQSNGVPVHPSLLSNQPTYENYQARNHGAVIAMNYGYEGKTIDECDFSYGLNEKSLKAYSLIVERCLDEPGLPIWAAFNQTVQELELHYSGAERYDLFHRAFSYVRLEERRLIVESLIDENVLFLGHDYPSDLLSKYPNKFHKIFNGNASSVIKQHKVSISAALSHWSYHARRIFDAVLMGNAIMCDYHKPTEDFFGVDTLNRFKYKNSNAADILNNILDNDAISFERTIKSYETLSKEQKYFASYYRLFDSIEEYYYR